MILPSEAAGLSIKDLSPQLKACIAMLADNRAVTVARATYASYPASTSAPVIMSFTFPGYSVRLGRQIRISVFGTGINNSGGVVQVGPVARFTGLNGVVIELGGPATVPAGAGDFAWHSEILVAASVPGASGAYAPAINRAATTDGNSYVTGLSSGNAISFTGGSTAIVSNTLLTSGPNFGGFVHIASPTTGSTVYGTKFQQVFDTTQSIRVDVRLPTVPAGANSYIAVASGMMEVL